MALLLPKSIFYHVPKTGGMWVRRAITAAGIPTKEIGGSIHSSFGSACVRGKFLFAFVRHPATWYPSIWKYRMTHGFKNDEVFDRCMSDNFEIFLQNMLENCPGFLGRRYEDYVGPPPGVLDFVGKQENLVENLILALRMASEDFDEAKIRSIPRINVSENHPAYPKGSLERLMESEAEAISRFGYRDANPVAWHEKTFFSGPWVPGATAIGTSMLPFFKPQDDVWHEVAQPEEIRRGDVVTFYVKQRFSYSKPISLVTHRIVNVMRQKEGVTFLTKGDNKLEADEPVFPSQVVGRVIQAGGHDLTQTGWRFLSNVLARISYFQWVFYASLKDSRLNRWRHAWERRGRFPKIRLKEMFLKFSNPFWVVSIPGKVSEGWARWKVRSGLAATGVSFRLMGPSDVPEMVRVWNESFPAHRTTEERLDRLVLKSPWFDSSGCFVALKGTRLLGWIMAGLREKEDRLPAESGFIEAAAVTTEGAHRQVERVLVEKALDWLGRHNVRQAMTGRIFVESPFFLELRRRGFLVSALVSEMTVKASAYVSTQASAARPNIRHFEAGDESAVFDFLMRNHMKAIQLSYRAFLEKGGDPRSILLAVEKGQVAGFGRFLTAEAVRDFTQLRWAWSSAAHELTAGYFFQFLVDPSWNRRGFGTALADKAFKSLFQQGCGQVRLWTSAQGFYQRFGFVAGGQFAAMKKNHLK